MSTPRSEPARTAVEALAARISVWQHRHDALGQACIIIGKKVLKRIETPLMNDGFSRSWLEPILQFIQESAEDLINEGSDAEGTVGSLIAEVAALRFESLEFESRFDRQAKDHRRLEQRIEKFEKKKQGTT